MRSNLYTKVVLTIIALILGLIAYHIRPRTASLEPKHVPQTVGANTHSIQTVQPGVYAFQSAIPFAGSQGMCWDLRSQDVGNDYVRIQQNGCNGTQYQHFIVGNPDSNGFYEVTTQLSGYQYVDNSGVIGRGLSAYNGGGLPSSLWHWRFEDVPNGSGRRYIKSEYDGTCVDRPTESMNLGDRVQTYTCNGSENQQWIPIGPLVPNATNSGAK
jgi:hypothetical protein